MTGLEPATAGFEVQRADQLRHTVHLGCLNLFSIFHSILTVCLQPVARFELATPCLQGRCNNHYAIPALLA